jgi:hypothetical protein
LWKIGSGFPKDTPEECRHSWNTSHRPLAAIPTNNAISSAIPGSIHFR